jgi:hypothetical protein
VSLLSGRKFYKSNQAAPVQSCAESHDAVEVPHHALDDRKPEVVVARLGSIAMETIGQSLEIGLGDTREIIEQRATSQL